MKEVSIFYLNKLHAPGGVITALIHTVEAFKRHGYDVQVYARPKRTEYVTRLLMGKVPYVNLSPRDCIVYAASRPTIIMNTFQPPKRAEDPYEKLGYCDLEIARGMCKGGALFMFHSTWEISDHALEVVRDAKTKPVVIREKFRDVLREKGIESTFTPHIYCREFKQHDAEKRRRAINAISLSRIALGKNPEVIVRANDMLEPQHRCHMYGFVERPYVHRTKMDEKLPTWRGYHRGEFAPGNGARLARNANYVVDMTYGSIFSNDGGGTQYTFLESWDAGANLVVHNEWLKIPGPDSIADEVHAVGSEQELADLLRTAPDPRVRARARERLEKHAPEAVVPIFERALRESYGPRLF